MSTAEHEKNVDGQPPSRMTEIVDETGFDTPARPRSFQSLFRSSSACAISMIVHGFCREVLQELPMEFAVEAQALLGLSLEGSVG